MSKFWRIHRIIRGSVWRSRQRAIQLTSQQASQPTNQRASKPARQPSRQRPYRVQSLHPVWVLLMLCAQASNSFGAQSLSAIAGVAAVALESAAKAKGYQNVEVQIRPLDNRIQLADCGEHLTTLPSTQQHVLGAMSVGVRCNGPQPWTLYVRGNVTAQQVVPVLKHAMGRGDIIGADDITVEQRLIGSDTGGTITDPEDLLGYAARRPLRQGDEIQFSDVVAPQIIERGQQVTIVSAYGGLQVSMQGKALANGASGDRVLVTNLSSGKRVEGVVNPRGEIVVP